MVPSRPGCSSVHAEPDDCMRQFSPRYMEQRRGYGSCADHASYVKVTSSVTIVAALSKGRFLKLTRLTEDDLDISTARGSQHTPSFSIFGSLRGLSSYWASRDGAFEYLIFSPWPSVRR